MLIILTQQQPLSLEEDQLNLMNGNLKKIKK